MPLTLAAMGEQKHKVLNATKAESAGVRAAKSD